MVDKLDHLHITGRNVEWYNCSGKFGTFLKYQICTYRTTQKSHYCKFIPGGGGETWCSYKDLYVSVHSSFIYNEQYLHNPTVLQEVQEVNDQTVLYPYHEILLNNKKEWSTDTCNSLDESHGNCAAWKKLSLKGTYYILSLLYNFQNDKIKWLEINQWLPGMMKGREHGGCGYKS